MTRTARALLLALLAFAACAAPAAAGRRRRRDRLTTSRAPTPPSSSSSATTTRARSTSTSTRCGSSTAPTAAARSTARIDLPAVTLDAGGYYVVCADYRQIDPAPASDGGEPNGNIRVSFLFRKDRSDLRFVDRPSGTR